MYAKRVDWSADVTLYRPDSSRQPNVRLELERLPLMTKYAIRLLAPFPTIVPQRTVLTFLFPRNFFTTNERSTTNYGCCHLASLSGSV